MPPTLKGRGTSSKGIVGQSLAGVSDFFDEAFSLENREGTLEATGALAGGVLSIADAMVQASGEKARARSLRVRAAQIRAEGIFAVSAAQEEGQRTIGAQRAVRGFQGVTMDGSSLDVLAETAEDAAWNASVIAYNYETAEAATLYQARLAKFSADQAKLSAVSSAFGTVSGVASGLGKLDGGFLSG